MLDDWLMDAARQAGAAILENVTAISYEAGHDCASVQVTSKDGNRTLRARLVIGADGSSSTIARQLRGGPPPDGSRIIAARAYYEDYDGLADRADLYFAGESFPGYYWLFPTSEPRRGEFVCRRSRRRWRNVAMSSGSARIGDLSLRAL
jgi:flavin-dependent dehydrogenase